MVNNNNSNNLTEEVSTLSERVTSLDSQIKFNKNWTDGKIHSIEDKFTKLDDTYSSINEKCNHMYSIKEHLFSTLALFFGIFTLISIDIGLTKSIFSSSECLKNHNYSIVCLVAIVIIQIIFCLSIYCFLVKPFLQSTSLNKSNEKKSLLKIKKAIIYGVVLIIGTLIISFFLYKHSNLVNNIKDLEKEINELKSTISELNKHKK